MSERLDDLLAAMCAGDLTASEQRELDVLLGSDPAALATAVAQWRLHRQLPLALRGTSGDWFPAAVGTALQRPSAVIRRPRLVRKRRRKPAAAVWLLPVAAAALLMLGLGVWLLGGSPTPADVPPALQDESVVARNPHGPAALPPGIAVTGGGRLVARGEAWHLAEGRVEIQADHRAKALTFTTPHVKVEVVGTRFSLEVLPAATVVAVSEGRVKVAVGEQVREVAAGEAVRSDAMAQPAPAGSRPLWSLTWPTVADPGWVGLPQGEGMLAQVNPDHPKDLIVKTSWLNSVPVIPAGGRWSITYRLLAEAPRRGAFWMLAAPADGSLNVLCQVEFQMMPGSNTIVFELAQLRHRETGVPVPVVGARVLMLSLQGWDGVSDGYVWNACELLAPDSR